MSSQPSSTNTEIAEEIKNLILKISETGEKIKLQISGFRQSYKDCNWVSEWQGQDLMTPQYMRLVCENGYDYFKRYIIEPLLITLLDYRDHLLGTKAYTASFQIKMKGLISSIHRYVVVSSFFGNRPEYLYPGFSEKDIENRSQYKKETLELNRRLMGCDDKDKFPIRKIALRAGMDGDHKKILEYMGDKCIFLRKDLLK